MVAVLRRVCTMASQPKENDRLASLDAHDKKRLRPGELIFAVALTVLAIALVSQLGEQTKYDRRLPLVMQPGFWPGISLAGMAVCGLVLSFLCWRCQRREGPSGGDLEQIWLIVQSGEFMLWFMAYVGATPWVGYLVSTAAFMMCLAWRAGYRSARIQTITVGIAFGIVVLFKSVLGVRIPGGAVYDLLPSGLQTFMAVNF